MRLVGGSMQDAELYTRTNHLQYKEAKSFLDMCSSGGHMSFKGSECILDVGCGPGDVTARLLLPLIPPQAQLVGVDLSHFVIAHANDNFASERVSFKQANIEDPFFNGDIKSKKFDKIFSFHCMNWIKNHRQAFQNINNMLKSGGSIYLLFVASSKLDDLNKCLLQHPKWKHQLKVLNDYNPNVNIEGDVETYFYKLLKDLNFNIVECNLIESKHTFKNMQLIIDHLISLQPAANEMTEEDKMQFMEDIENLILKEKMVTIDDSTGQTTASYHIFRIIAHKSL